MGTTAEKLYKILDSKEQIKQALLDKGIEITDETTFAEYAEKINEITNGGAITDEEALLFIKDLAEGKRKIAKALTQKYEPTNEYETFDEMAEKIKTLPLEIREDIPQPYFVVFNEMQKAFRSRSLYRLPLYITFAVLSRKHGIHRQILQLFRCF